MKFSAGTVLSFSALLASTASAAHNLDDIPQWDTKDYLKQAGFYEGKMDGYMRKLKSAVRRADLGKRDDGIKVVHDISMLYAENENEFGVYGGKKVFRSEVTGQTKEPTLMIEKFDNHLDSVKCSGKTVELNFNNIQSFEEAKQTTSDSQGYNVITSHPGCNTDDERRVFKVEDVSTDEDSMQVKLHVAKTQFQDIFSSMSMDYGESEEPHVLRKNARRERENLAKRTYEPSWTYPAMSLSAGVPSGTPGSDHGSTNLHWEVKDEGFTLPQIVTDHMVAALEVGCNDCRQEGQATFTQGKFDFDFDIDWSDFDIDVFKGGWVQLDVTDYSLHMDMYATPSGSVYFFEPLVNIPFPGAGYVIPGFGKLGITFSPAVLGSMTVTSPIEFDFGFDVTMPDSSIKVDFGNMDGNLEGWNPDVSALPFSANDTQPSLSFTGAFMPRIPIGFQFGTPDEGGALPDGGITAEVGIFASTPQIVYEFTPGCGAGNSTDLAVRDSGDLIKMSPTVSIGAGFDLSAYVRIDGTNPGIFTRTTLISTDWALPTHCYSVDLEAGTWSEVQADSTPAANIVKKAPFPAHAAQVTESPEAKRAVHFGF